jgi:hypothetical protein
MSSKVEECFPKIQDIIHVVQLPNPSALPSAGGMAAAAFVTEDLVLECELHMLDALNHFLVVFHPYRPLLQYAPCLSVLCNRVSASAYVAGFCC